MIIKSFLFGMVLGGAGVIGGGIGYLAALFALSEANEAALIGSITPTIVAIGAIVASVLSYRAAKEARQEARDAKVEAQVASEQVAKNTVITENVSKLVNGQQTAMNEALKKSNDKVDALEKAQVSAENLVVFRETIKEALAVTPVIPAAVAERVAAAPVQPAPAPSSVPKSEG